MPIPEFVAKLRAPVGEELLWRHLRRRSCWPSAAASLLAQRSDTAACALPGGIIDPAEVRALAVRRQPWDG